MASKYSLHKGSDSVVDFCCSPCSEEVKDTEATFYCEKCVKFFCDQCCKPHTQLYKTHTTFGRRDMKQWPVSKTTEDFIEKCEEHVGEKVKLYCDDHNQLCCSTCVLLNHRTCKRVSTIPDFVKYQSTEDVHQHLLSINICLGKIEKVLKSKKTNAQSFEDSCNDRLKEIRDFRQTLNATLDELEKKTIKELVDIRNGLQASLKADVDYCTKLKNDLKQLTEAAHDLGDKNKKELEFIFGKKCLDSIQKSEGFVKASAVSVETLITFQPDNGIDDYLSKHSGLGLINYRSSDQVITIKMKTEFCLATIPASNCCSIIDICQLSNGQIFLADNRNKRVLMLDKQFQVISQCGMSTYVQALCQTGTDMLAVALNEDIKGDKHDVQYIFVKNDQLVNGKNLPMSHNCIGIAHHQGRLYITSGTALYHYTLAGSLVEKLYEDTSGLRSVFKCAVSPRCDRIYVVNQEKYQLLTLATNGTVLGIFSDNQLINPLHVHVTNFGQVLVTAHDSNCIIQMDREGKKKLATLAPHTDAVNNPFSVWYSSYTDTLIVGIVDSNYLLVFNV
ncbi:uncharacterized protein LOC127845310 [Dreissena polymorpha]|uniref:B box-type domain-containing protein n=1 Tax=Dreissena polymorpha TaxID=45954 RepID=A0A9D4EDE4_DREPO|nr:uncharacterized protein LOC127845310 [Dreissena polymorpha]KAH3777676.1 hypothetical protein DPMN_179124 [Dreissena polymorpha]